MEKMTASKVHGINRKQIFNLIYNNNRISRAQLSEELGLSLPAISQHLKDMEDKGLIRRKGHFESTGGRKPDMYWCVDDAKIAIGLHIRKNVVTAVAIDLYGKILGTRNVSKTYFHSEDYYKFIGYTVNEFVKDLGYDESKILGVGIALTAILSKNRREIRKSILLGQRNTKIDDFAKWIKYPCQMFHDSEAAASGEIWFSKNINDALYLGLNHHLNGTLIIDGEIHEGKEYTGGLVEHMVLIPGGKQCYCGRKGCFSAYCSGKVLFEDNKESRDIFFSELRGGNENAREKWNEFLKHLSVAVGSLYSVLDCDIIMGGEIGSYMTKQDAMKIQKMAFENYEFAAESDFVCLGHDHPNISACGAAIYFISEFLEEQ